MTRQRQNQSESAAWHVVPFRAAFGPEVCAWRYPAPYDVYNWPCWEELAARGDEFADPALRAAQYAAVADGAGVGGAGVSADGAGGTVGAGVDGAGVDGAGVDGAGVDGAGGLVGYGQLFPLVDDSGAPVIRLGLGLRPDLCGRGGGLGARLVELLVEEARRRQPGCSIDLEVLTWNERAIRTYRKAGFTVADTYVRDTPTGPDAFYCMVYEG